MEGAHESYPERLAKQAEKVVETADSGAVLIADAILAHSGALHRLASEIEELRKGGIPSTQQPKAGAADGR